MTGRRGDGARVADMLRSAERLEEILRLGYDAFAASWVSQSAVIRELEVLGEAAGHMSSEVRLAHPEIIWNKMRGFSSFAKHEYWRINPEQLWKAVEAMPSLHKKVAAVKVSQ
jgi:uncharacterized protein with HEPN domain